MHTVDTKRFDAPMARVWQLACEVERWSELLPHYREVRRIIGDPGGDGEVAMVAWRPFGAGIRWPVWWQSKVWIDADRREIRYRHVAGITTGMAVVWRLVATDADTTEVTIVHDWSGPAWPVIGSLAARLVIGPVFVHGIAKRTLAGLAACARSGNR